MSTAMALDDLLRMLTDAQRSVSATRQRLGRTPAEDWLPHIETAVVALETAYQEAFALCATDVHAALWQASKSHANAIAALASTYPEVRRLRVVEIALGAVKWALWDLTEEGLPPVKRLPALNYEDLP